MNKILAHVILKSFSFHFIYIKKKKISTFPPFGLYIIGMCYLVLFSFDIDSKLSWIVYPKMIIMYPFMTKTK